MTEEVKPDVIKKTQDSLKKHIKKPPLTEKLLKKPPFRFLHDIITNVIKETGFLDGLFTTEELNHENIKDRDGKIAFLDKLISAVKIITGIPLSVRATKIVAGHEPTKTNELLQAIGLALDKKLDSKDIALQLRKKGNKKSDAPDSKKSSPREAKQERTEAGKSKSQEKSSNQIEEGSDKKKTSNKQSKGGQEAESDKKKRSSSTSKQPKTKEPSKSVKSKKENIISESKTDSPKEMKEEATIHAQLPDKTPSKEEVPASEAVNSEAEQYRTASRRRSSSARQQIEENSQIQDQQPAATPISPKKTVERKNSPQQKEAPPLPTLPPLHPDQSSNGAPPKSEKPPPASTTSTRAPSAAPTQTSSHPQTQPQVPVPVPLARPRTAARVGSARPGAPRVRNRGEALVVNEEVKAAPVNLIVEDENNKTSHEDEDENLVVVESAPVEGITEDLQPSAPTMSRPSSQQGHLVAQILETQKELEVSKGIDNGEINQHHTEIEWEAGRRRERETAAKEVDRMRSLIQTLTRAAHPLGKLLDSLQEDVDNMQRELSQWQSMQISLEQQLQMEENLSAQASQPLKEQLKQLQQAVRMQLDQISSAKANIISNDERIRRLLTSGQS